MLEDVICLVFLEFEAPAFIAKHDDEKVKDILAKTAKKMSANGLEAAGQLPMDARLARLLGEALAGYVIACIRLPVAGNNGMRQAWSA